MVTGLHDRLCIATASALSLSMGCNLIDEGVTPAPRDASPDNQSPGADPFPDRCSIDELSTQELVLLFQLFELTRCEPH